LFAEHYYYFSLQFCGSFKFCLGEINAQEKKVVGEVHDQGEQRKCFYFKEI
jgi:hypothetical protein